MFVKLSNRLILLCIVTLYIIFLHFNITHCQTFNTTTVTITNTTNTPTATITDTTNTTTVTIPNTTTNNITTVTIPNTTVTIADTTNTTPITPPAISTPDFTVNYEPNIAKGTFSFGHTVGKFCPNQNYIVTLKSIIPNLSLNYRIILIAYVIDDGIVKTVNTSKGFINNCSTSLSSSCYTVNQTAIPVQNGIQPYRYENIVLFNNNSSSSTQLEFNFDTSATFLVISYSAIENNTMSTANLLISLVPDDASIVNKYESYFMTDLSKLELICNTPITSSSSAFNCVNLLTIVVILLMILNYI